MESKTRVVIACDTFPPDINGAARFAERLAAGLARRDHEVHIIAPAPDGSQFSGVEIHDGAELMVHRMPSYAVFSHKSARVMRPLGLDAKLGALLDEIKPDAVHIQSHLMIGRHLVKESKKRGIRTIATNHTMPENIIKYSVLVPAIFEPMAMKIAWRDTAKVLRKMDRVTTPTRRAAELLERETGIRDVLAISCGIDASRFATRTKTSNALPKVLFVGRLDYEKKVDVLLRAVAEISSDIDVKLEIIGDGAEARSLKKLAQELGISDRVQFSGHVTEIELPLAYERATVFAMPSIAELQSIATMEAMATGRPIIAADAMALPHLVHHEDNGYLYEPEDVGELAMRLRQVLTASQEELDRLSENSLHLIQSHDISTTLNIFEDLYLGIGDVSPTTEDNRAEYMEPIGRLSSSLRERVKSFQNRAHELRERMDEIRYGVRGRFDDARGDFRDQLGEFRQDFSRRARKITRRDKPQDD